MNLLRYDKDQKKKILNAIKTGKANSESKVVVVQNGPETSKADMEVPGSLRCLCTGPQDGMDASSWQLCMVVSLGASNTEFAGFQREQPHPLGLTGVLPPTDRIYHQVWLRIAYSWPT